MGIAELFLIGVGLSMDAFAVAVCKGLAMPRMRWRQAAGIALSFGLFQALMPILGWALGRQFETYITSVDHWIAFVLLSLIGGNMIREALSKEEEDCDPSLAPLTMLVLAVATSIDALAVGVTFAFLQVDNIVLAVAFIGVITFALSAAGVKVGAAFGVRFKSKAELAGGIILMGMGLKILAEHTLLS